MSKILKLRLPIWSEIIYLLFVLLIPVVFTCIELFSSHSTIFKITFSSVGCALISLICIKKFVFNSKIKKLQEKCILLEHDYSMEVGNVKNAVKLWTLYNVIIFLYNAIVVLMSGILCIIFVSALTDGLIKFKGASVLIFISVIVGLLYKVIAYIIFMRVHVKFKSEKVNE